MKKRSVYVIIIYLLAFGINFITSIKYPDSHITILNFIVSILFLVTIFLSLKTVVISKKYKMFKFMMIGGMVSGIFVFIVTEFNHIIYKYFILDIISGIQYPLYSLFVTPLFGLNYIFNVSYGLFSAIMSLFYLIALGIMLHYLSEVT